MNKKVETELNKILADKTSGSVELLERINFFLHKNYNQIPNKLSIISSLQQHFKSFENIQSYLKKLKLLIQQDSLSINFFKKFKINSSSTFNKIYSNALPFLKKKKTILTISNSTTVFETINRLPTKDKLHLIICESRPKLEGRSLAKKLIHEKIKVELITEALAGNYIQKCDCVLIGADAILKNSNVVNKIGSLQLAILCRYYKKPFYVLADRSKFSSRMKSKQKKEDSDEVWKGAPKKMIIKNIYFEEIPKYLITKIITD